MPCCSSATPAAASCRPHVENSAALEALTEEIAFYEEHFEEYRRKYAGRYLLIHGAELIGVYDDELEADYEGYRQVWRTGTEDRGYLVKKAGEPALPTVEMPIVTRTLGPSDAENPT